MGDSISPLMLKQVTKKGRVSINNRKCFISKSTSKDLPNPGEVAKKKFTELLILKNWQRNRNYRWLQRYCRL